MTRKFTFIKLSILTLSLCGILTAAKADGPYPVYLTQKGTVTLGLKAPLAGNTAVWTEDGTPVTPNADGSININASGKSVGVHTYNVHLVSPNTCDGEVTEYQVYILPTPAVTLATKGPTLYCTNADNPLAVLEATATAAALPAGVEYKFIWEGTLSGTTKPAGEWGEIAGSTATTSTFHFTTTEVGTFNLKVKVEYALSAGSTSVLRSDATTYAAMVSNTKSVEVAPQPAKPEIVIVSN